MKEIQPYIIFDGNCREAMTFYAKCLGGELRTSTFGETDPKSPPEAKDRLIHARLAKGATVLMASDSGAGMPVTNGDNVWLSILCDTDQEVDALFKSLGAGGKALLLPSVIGPAVRLRHSLMLLASCATLAAFAACGDKPAGSTAAAPGRPAPDTFRVAFETSRGPFVVAAIRGWAPNGADRFYALTRDGFFDENRFFRVVPGFVAQFGINTEKSVNERWDDIPLPDDPASQSNARGTIVFTSQGPNTRSHQMFVNLADNKRLDAQGFTPFGRVVSGMEAVDSIYSGYGERPVQQLIQTLGNSYLARMFPKLDYIKSAKLVAAPAPSH